MTMNAALKEYSEEGGWRCYVTSSSAASSNVELDLSINELLSSIETFPKVLKDDRRSLVKLGSIHGAKLVAKQPRDKNKRKWARFLTLFSAGEARKTFTTLSEFKNKGIESLTPFCLLEKRQLGMVVDSWLLYYYREGKESDKSYLAQVVDLLKKLHRGGYQHGDPNFGNFMVGSNDELFLIDCKGKSRSGQFSDYYDFMLLGRGELTTQEIETAVDMDKASLGYRLAKLYQSYISLRSSFKKKIGRKRSKSEHTMVYGKAMKTMRI